jgi:hypothetical protein
MDLTMKMLNPNLEKRYGSGSATLDKSIVRKGKPGGIFKLCEDRQA